MTNSEARQILIDYNTWRMGSGNQPFPIKVDKAIDAAIVALGDSETLDLSIAYQAGYFDGKRSKSSIAQAIRDAAVNLDKLSDAYWRVADAFCDYIEQCGIAHYLGSREDNITSRTFMLFVAEALES